MEDAGSSTLSSKFDETCVPEMKITSEEMPTSYSKAKFDEASRSSTPQLKDYPPDPSPPSPSPPSPPQVTFTTSRGFHSRKIFLSLLTALACSFTLNILWVTIGVTRSLPPRYLEFHHSLFYSCKAGQPAFNFTPQIEMNPAPAAATPQQIYSHSHEYFSQHAHDDSAFDFNFDV